MQKQYSFIEIEEYVAYLYQGRRVDISSFWYPFIFTALAANASQTVNSSIASDSDFLITAINVDAGMIGGAAGHLLQIVDSASNERFFDNAARLVFPFAISQFAANGALAMPRFVSANANLSMTLTAGAVGGGTAAGQIGLEGVRVRVYG